MTVAIPMIVGLLIAATIAIIVIVTGGQVDPIQTDQVSRVSECWMEGCR